MLRVLKRQFGRLADTDPLEIFVPDGVGFAFPAATGSGCRRRSRFAAIHSLHCRAPAALHGGGSRVPPLSP
jgi:hypothetical protein